MCVMFLSVLCGIYLYHFFAVCTVTRQRDITVTASCRLCNGILTDDQRRFRRAEARSLRLESDRTARQAPPHTQCYHSQGAAPPWQQCPRMNSRQSFSPRANACTVQCAESTSDGVDWSLRLSVSQQHVQASLHNEKQRSFCPYRPTEYSTNV